MGERQELVLTQSIESPVISPEQKDILVRQTTLYLQSKRVHIDKNTFNLGAEVVVDALRRGLNLSGVDITKAGKGVTKYVKAGIEERDAIRIGVRKIINKADDIGDAQYVGDLALSRQLIEQVSTEANNFYLKGDISNSERLLMLSKTREQNLGEISDKVVGYLPDVLIANARDQLKTNDEKSRFIKNALVNVVFSDRIQPIVSIDELWNHFTSYQQNSRKFFSEEQFNGIVGELDLDEDQTNYLRDLFLQTKGNFESKKGEAFPVSFRDRFYMKFSRNFLLLHPALEEEQIVLDYDKQDGHTPSVWDDGVCHEVKGYKVPSRGILIAALRQAEAKGSIGRANRIKEAIKSWSLIDADRTNLPKRINLTQKQLDYENKAIGALRKKWGKKTNPRVRIEDILKKKQNELGSVSITFKLHERQVNSSRERLTEAADLLALARESDGQKFRLPKEYFMNIIDRKVLSYSVSINNLSRIVDKDGEVLANKLAGGKKFDLIKGAISRIATKIYNSEEFLHYANEFKNIYETVMNSKEMHIFKEIPTERKIELRMFLSDQINLLNNESFRTRYGFARVKKWDLNMFKTLLDKNPEDARLLNMSSKIFLRTVRPLVIKLEKQYGAIKKAKEGREEVIRKRSLLSGGNEDLLGDDAYRTIEWGENFNKERQISELGDVLSENLDSDALKFSSLCLTNVAKYLPQTVDKDGYRQAIEKSFPVMQNHIERSRLWVELEKERHPKDYEKNSDYLFRLSRLLISIDDLNQAHWFLQQLDSRLFRFDIASGMKTKRYLDLISKKILLIKRLKALPKLREEYVRISSEVETLGKEFEVNRALKRKAEIAQRLKDLKAIDPMDIHIERMKNLGFAVKV